MYCAGGPEHIQRVLFRFAMRGGCLLGWERRTTSTSNRGRTRLDDMVEDIRQGLSESRCNAPRIEIALARVLVAQALREFFKSVAASALISRIYASGMSYPSLQSSIRSTSNGTNVQGRDGGNTFAIKLSLQSSCVSISILSSRNLTIE